MSGTGSVHELNSVFAALDLLFVAIIRTEISVLSVRLWKGQVVPDYEVPPLSWTPKHLCFRSPRCRRNAPHTRLSSGGR